MKKRGFILNDRLTEAQVEKFKLFEDEELIFACREHWLPLLLRLIKRTLLGVAIAVGCATVFVFALHDVILAVSAFLLVLLISSIVYVRDLIHWSFHLYIATTKQIIEVHYSPLLSQAVNSILLDQIRCTEIDVAMFGIIPELIGIGDVEITFDRPTHKEIFIIKSIRSPRVIANILSAQIHQGILAKSLNQYKQPLWTKELKNNKYRFLGDTNYGYIPS